MILIKKHIIKNTLTLKKVLFIGLLSLIFNSNLHAQLAGPSSSWNTVIQSDVYGDAIYENDANKEDLFGNATNPVLQSAFNGNNIYFRVLLNGEADQLDKDFKFFIGIDADKDGDIDIFIGNNAKHGQYHLSQNSYFQENEKGKLFNSVIVPLVSNPQYPCNLLALTITF